jgi:hypothetical protein
MKFYAVERCNMLPQDGTAGPSEVRLMINKSRTYTLKIEPKYPFPRCDGVDLAAGHENPAPNLLRMMEVMCGKDTCLGKDVGCTK